MDIWNTLITEQLRGVRSVVPMSCSKNVNQVISTIIDTVDQCFASKLEQAIVDCFFEHHKIQFAQKKTQKPMVLLLVIEHPIQLPSLKAYNEGLYER